MHKDKVLNLALHVRNVIVKNRNFHITKMDIGFRDFPTARCDIASEILKRYLDENGITDFYFIGKEGVNAEGKPFHHVWLENSIYSLDITSSQYNSIWSELCFPELVLVNKGEFYFNKQDGDYFIYYPEAFNPPAPGLGYANYEEFYQNFLAEKSLKIF